ncbi:uncharacterized protein EV420DRAFT_1652635 [Desarmillaria tabescens]|uniref:Uncharacterized protein n=1 Tax=Armillaria tabescens TaxID=1929756 RepID=A0AA39J502_ARMTA|nr:uncharacterized protein EV420DRAFT_1652635 [Desarmillaria tabescens]KAK0436193.1 hypothetical protein EV420DRAFT_1652635 [Desarmillaria tabescens]
MVDLPPIPPEPCPPTLLESEEQFGNPFKYPHEISEIICPLLLADSGCSTTSEILSVVEQVHPLLVAYVEELKKNNQKSDRIGILLCQTCYSFACQTPPCHHKMKEWSIWAPTAEEYDLLPPDKASFLFLHFFSVTHRYKNREAQYLKYKMEWIESDKAYRDALKSHEQAIKLHEKAKQTRAATELKAKKGLKEKKLKLLAVAGQTKTDPKAKASQKPKRYGQFKVQMLESMQLSISYTSFQSFTEPENVLKVACLEASNLHQIPLPPSETNDASSASTFSFDPVLLSRVLDLGPPQRAMCYSCFMAGHGVSCDHDEFTSGTCMCCHDGHRGCKSLACSPGDQRQLVNTVFQASHSSNEAITHQVAQIEHCQSLVSGLSQIVAFEDGTPGDSIPVLKEMVCKYPLLQRLVEVGLLKLNDPNLSPAYIGHLANDHTSSTSSVSTKPSPETMEGSSASSQGTDDEVMET